MEIKYLPSFANDFPYIVVWDKENVIVCQKQKQMPKQSGIQALSF